MFIALIILNSLLALMFLMAGTNKVLRDTDGLRAMGMNWVDNYSPLTVKGIGALEIVGALGLLLPVLLNIVPVLTVVAAAGLAVVMIGAAVVHVRLKEQFTMQVVLAVLCAVSAVLGALVIFN